jgi:hypothetical protein
LDINKIFGSFDSSSNDGWVPRGYDYTDYRSLPIIDENHPRYMVRMFWKLILNHLSYSKQLINFFGSADSTISTEEIEYVGEKMLYSRAYGYISQIDIEDEYHQKILKEDKQKELLKAYGFAINFYENEEEYEKCAFLKKQLDFIKFSS